jgi:ketosteroid isomerase-like protein
MKIRILFLLSVVLLSAAGLHAQSTPDAGDLTALLNEFLAGASRNDAAVHDKFWADDLIYTRSAGVRTNKAELMKGVRSAPAAKPDDPKTVYSADDIQIHQYGDVAVVAFKLVAATTKGGATEVSSYLNTGTFVKRRGRWQAVAWQSTAVPKPAPAKP